MKTIHEGDGFRCKLECQNIVCRCQGVIVLEINFMLAFRHFMMGGFNFKTHAGKGDDDLCPDIFCKVGWSQIKITSHILELRCWHPKFIPLKEEELQFGARIEYIPHGSGLTEHILQDMTGITCKWLSIGEMHITDKPGNP